MGALVAGTLVAPGASWAQLGGGHNAFSDTFTLNNDSQGAILVGTSNWGRDLHPGCATGPFPAANVTDYSFHPGDSGTVTLSRISHEGCPGAIPPLGSPDTGIRLRSGLAGTWSWVPVDPAFGWATLTCGVSGQRGTAAARLRSQVNDLTCTIFSPDARAAGTFGSSAAPVRRGRAVVLAQHFPGSKGGSAAAPGARSARKKGPPRGRYKVILRNRKGRAHGRKTVTIVSGAPRKVRVPVPPKLRRQVKKRGFVRVRAILKRIDGKPGSGHRVTLALTRDHPGLPF